MSSRRISQVREKLRLRKFHRKCLQNMGKLRITYFIIYENSGKNMEKMLEDMSKLLFRLYNHNLKIIYPRREPYFNHTLPIIFFPYFSILFFTRVYSTILKVDELYYTICFTFN